MSDFDKREQMGRLFQAYFERKRVKSRLLAFFNQQKELSGKRVLLKVKGEQLANKLIS